MARILVADDSLIMRRNLKTMLEQAGHEVVAEAVNGSQAFVEYEKHKPELVTMDITMPGMNGLEAIRKITDFDPLARIVVVSALAERDMVLEALECGALNYIIKPIVFEKVCKVVQDALEAEAKAPVKKQAEPVVRPAVAPGEGRFTILNDNGIFIINVVPHICFGGQESAVYTAVQGLLYVSPLTVIMDFGKTEPEQSEFDRLLEIMDSIRRGGGKVFCRSVPERYEKVLRLAGYSAAE